MILLCCAVGAELGFWKERDGVDKLTLGVGPVEAAAAVATALANRDYSLVVNAGLGGAFSGAAQIGVMGAAAACEVCGANVSAVRFDDLRAWPQ